MASSPREHPGEKIVVGWREYAALPEWGIAGVKAKLDTGARSSAIDVAKIEELPGGRVRFEIALKRNHAGRCVRCESAIVRRTRVRSAHGTVHERIMIRTTLVLGGVEKQVELGLVCRRQMLCRMLIGRRALEPDFLVDPGRRYRFGRPRRSRPPEKRTPEDGTAGDGARNDGTRESAP